MCACARVRVVFVCLFRVCVKQRTEEAVKVLSAAIESCLCVSPSRLDVRETTRVLGLVDPSSQEKLDAVTARVLRKRLKAKGGGGVPRQALQNRGGRGEREEGEMKELAEDVARRVIYPLEEMDQMGQELERLEEEGRSLRQARSAAQTREMSARGFAEGESETKAADIRRLQEALEKKEKDCKDREAKIQRLEGQLVERGAAMYHLEQRVWTVEMASRGLEGMVAAKKETIQAQKVTIQEQREANQVQRDVIRQQQQREIARLRRKRGASESPEGPDSKSPKH